MNLRKFFDYYSTKKTNTEKLNFLKEEQEIFSKENQNEEASLLSVLIDLLSGKMSEAKEKYEDRYLKVNGLPRLIAEGTYNLVLGRRYHNKSNLLQKSRDDFENALKLDDSIPYLYSRLSKAYRYLGLFSEDKDEAMKNFGKSISQLEIAIEKIGDRNKSALAYYYNEMGNTYLDMKNYCCAQLNFFKSIQADSKFPLSHTGMGNYYRTQSNYIEAIESYKTALKLLDYKENSDKNHNECFYPLNYKGDCYRFLEEYKKAEEMYVKATKVDSTHSYGWHGLGRVFYELGNRNCNSMEYYEIAEHYFKKSLKSNSSFKYVYYSLGRIYDKTQKYQEAKKNYNKSKERFPKFTYSDEKAAEYINEIINKQKISERIASSKLENILPIERIIIDTIDSKISDRVFLKKDSFTQTFLKERYFPIKEDKNEITLEILRRWNSYTPIIADNSRGGGYFLKAFGKGIVVDPGFNFIDNFRDAGYTFADIDIVLISHAHDDHTADLESIINLLYRYNKELREYKLPKQIAKEKNTSISSIKTQEEDRNSRFQKYKKALYLYVSEGVMKKYKPYFTKDAEQEKKDLGGAYILRDGEDTINKIIYAYGIKELKLGKTGYYETIILNEDDSIEHQEIKMTALKANHNDIMGKVASLGFKLDLGETVLIYTGDSGWSSELEKQYNEIGAECRAKGKHIILLAHIGGFDRNENKLIDLIGESTLDAAGREDKLFQQDNAKEYLYKTHLGRIGLARINETLQPDICIISEFGEEFKDLRKEVVRIFTDAYKYKLKTCFIPGDIGLKINIAKHTVKAITRINNKKQTIKYSFVDLDNIGIGENPKSNQLFYYNTLSGITEYDCLDALSKGFIEDTDNFSLLDKHRDILGLY